MFDLIHARIPADKVELKAAAAKLKDMTAEKVNAELFRMKPRHDTPKVNFVWCFGLMLADGCAPEYRAALHTLSDKTASAALKDYMRVAPQHSQDGPIVKWLAKLRDEDESESEGDAPQSGKGGGRKRRRPDRK